MGGASIGNVSKDQPLITLNEGSLEGDHGFSLELDAGAQEHTGMKGMLSPRGLEASIMRQDGTMEFLPIV